MVRSLCKTTAALHAVAKRKEGGIAAFIDAEHALIHRVQLL